MGSIYSREVLGYKKPRVGILSIGTEESKGNELTRTAAAAPTPSGTMYEKLAALIAT